VNPLPNVDIPQNTEISNISKYKKQKIKVKLQQYIYTYMAVTWVVKITCTQMKYTQLITSLNRYDQRPSEIDNVSDNNDMNVRGGLKKVRKSVQKSFIH
jgi:hypothetical protein